MRSDADRECAEGVDLICEELLFELADADDLHARFVMSFALGLPHDHPDLPATAEEARRDLRLMRRVVS